MGNTFGGLVRDNSALTQNGVTAPVGKDQALQVANKYLPVVAASTQPTIQNGPVSVTPGANPGDAPVMSGGPQLMFNSKPVNAPTITTPTFANVTEEKGGESQSPLSPALTTKGKILSSLLLAARGASDAIEGGALNARPGQSSFGTGFAAAADAPRRRFLEDIQNKQAQQSLDAAQQESQLRANEIANAPALFKQKYDLGNSEINKNNAMADVYGARETKLGTRQTKVVGNQLRDAQTGEVIGTYDPKKLDPKTRTQLLYVANDPNADDDSRATAQAALKQDAQIQQNQKAAPSGGTGDKSALNSKAASTAATFLQAHGGDANAALADFNGQIAGKQIDHSDLVIAAIKKGAGKGAKKPALTFNPQPQVAH